MGSLNSNGTKIVRQNVTYRNIGNYVSATSGLIPNGRDEVVSDNGSVPFLRGTDADQEVTQYTTINLAPTKKITNTVDDSLVSRNTTVLPVSASGNPEISLIPVRDYSDRHTGNRVVLGDASDDTVITRRDNTSFRPTS